jgi:hypothetical protein
MSDQTQTTDELVTLEDVTTKFNEAQATVPRLEAQMAEQVVNPIVLAKVLGVKPQMIYNYIRSGRINAVLHNNTQKKVIKLEDALAFARSYLDRKARAALKVEEQLEGASA